MSRSGPSISDRSAIGGRRRLRRALVVAAFVVAAIVLLRFIRGIGFEQLVDNRDMLQATVARNYAAALAIFAGTYLLFAAMAVPGGIVLMVTGGFLFGGWIGGLLSAAMATSGATLLFLAARSLLHDMLTATAGSLVERIRRGVRRTAWSYMLCLRLSPLAPFWLVNIGAALGGVPLRTFVWTTALGIVPATLTFAFAGENLDRLVRVASVALQTCRADGGDDCRLRLSMSDILTPAMLAFLVGASLLALLPALLRAWRAKHATAPVAP